MKLDRRNSALKKCSTANFLLLLLSSKLSDEIVNFAKITAIRSDKIAHLKPSNSIVISYDPLS